MADVFTPEKRSWLMSRIRGKNTKPERVVRSLLHRLGYRFTVNGPRNRELPGKPDIVLPKFRTVIFVHGCFWHRHKNCRLASTPKTRKAFWKKKFESNVKRDARAVRQLRKLEWKVVTIWECQLKNIDKIEKVAWRLVRRFEEVTDVQAITTYDEIRPPEEILRAAEESAAYGKPSSRLSPPRS